MNSSTAIEKLFEGFRSDVTFVACSEWHGPHHIFLQLANCVAFLGLTFASTGIKTLIFLRTMLLVSNLIIILWTWLVVCSSDLLLWNTIFAAVNLIHLIVLLVKLHPFIRFVCSLFVLYVSGPDS